MEDKKEIKVAEKKTKVTEPWKPCNILETKKIGGFRTRWTRVELIDKRIDEGWECVEQSNNKNIAPKITLLDGTSIQGVVQKRGLVLMRIPEDLAKSRDKYYESKGNISVDEFKKDVKDPKYDGTGAYGKIVIEGGMNG